MFAIEAPAVVALDPIIAAIQAVRIAHAGVAEAEIHDAVSKALAQRRIAHRREYAFGPRCRADIWVDGIVIEIKKQRPARAALISQVTRYAAQPAVRAIIVVLEKSVLLPAAIDDKQVAVISLNALWGIAL